MNKTFIFFHVPKTGGTSLRIHFQKNLKDQKEFIHLANKGDRFAKQMGLPPFEQRDLPTRNHAKVILGHRVNLKTVNLVSNQCTQIVFFRDPSGWIVSRYNQRMNHLAKHNKSLLSFSDWLKYEKKTNSQFDWFLVHCCQQDHNVVNLSLERKIALLDSILDKFYLVLPLSKLDSAINYFSNLLSIPKTTEPQNVVGVHKKNFFDASESNLKLISKSCIIDNKIHQHLKNKFEQSLKIMVAE